MNEGAIGCCIDASAILLYFERPLFGVKSLRKIKVAVFTAILLILPHFPASSQPDENLKIVIEEGIVEGDAATLSFRISNPYSPELMEIIKSGIEVKFEYEILIRRVHKNWFNRTVGEENILRKIMYDPLADEFVVEDGTGKGKKFFRTLHAAAMAFFSFHDLRVLLSPVSVSGKKYEVSVRAQLEDLDVTGIFKFIPFVSNWFRVKTDWARLRVKAR